jgi:glyoxylase-like metal-dependent hydrolase (beta-lactamase superfamily II)/ferredoxin
MARLEARLAQNVEGDFFVDDTCIDCDTCRQIAPSIYGRSEQIEQSYVQQQPRSEAERLRALMALVACPTASIGTVSKSDARGAASRFPERILGDVYYCGFTSTASFGGSSYLVRRANGNVLVDSPRAAGPLIRRLAELGGVRRMLLTHRDDVADHARFAEIFRCERVMHKDDLSGATRDVEVQLTGREATSLGDGFEAIPVPGHTRGSVAFLYQRTFLFTGDHLWWSPNVNGLHASPRVCWWDWEHQVESMERLLDYEFEWVLPGHGWRYQAPSPAVMKTELQRLIQRMRVKGATPEDA